MADGEEDQNKSREEEEEDEGEDQESVTSYCYADSEEEEETTFRNNVVVVDVEATAKVVGKTAAYQINKEWRECPYGGHQDEENCLKFYVRVWQDAVIEVELDKQHPLKPPRFDLSVPELLDPESAALIRRIEWCQPKKWNFCTRLVGLLKFVENVLRARGIACDEWTPLQKALYDLGVLCDALPKVLDDVLALENENLIDLPKFGQDSALQSSFQAQRRESAEDAQQQQQTVSSSSSSSAEKKEDDPTKDDDSAAKRRKLGGVGWRTGTGYGSGVLHESAKLPEPPVSQKARTDATNGEMLRLVEAIDASLSSRQEDFDYVKSVSPWQRAVLPFVSSVGVFEFEKYETLFRTIERVADKIGDAETLRVLKRRQDCFDESSNTTTTPSTFFGGASSSSSRRRNDNDRASSSLGSGAGGGREKTTVTTGVAMDTEYRRLLGPEHVLQCAMGADAHRSHKHHRRLNHSQVGSESTAVTPQLAKRAMREFQTLRDGLPLDEDSSIFARHNADNLLHFKLCIVPSRETPYAYGCFVFSILLGRDYPAVPPSVDFQTTDNGNVRFNPNLYADGKVCLSLLGTWPGRPEEQWDPDNSNLLSVALSIQALIFTDEPYFNEPGYEARRGTPAGDAALSTYNKDVKYHTKRVAVDKQLANPPPEFKAAITKHLTYHHANVLATFADVQRSASFSPSTAAGGLSSSSAAPGFPPLDALDDDDEPVAPVAPLHTASSSSSSSSHAAAAPSSGLHDDYFDDIAVFEGGPPSVGAPPPQPPL